MDAAFGRLLGFYMAEGSSSVASGQVQWTFHEDEVAYQQQVMDDLLAVFGLHAKLRLIPENHVGMVVCSSTLLAELLSCGTATTKTLPEWAWDGSSEFYASLLWAWVAGDGSLTYREWRGRTARRLPGRCAWLRWPAGTSPRCGLTPSPVRLSGAGDQARNHLHGRRCPGQGRAARNLPHRRPAPDISGARE